jgi:hypothetical protein
MVQSMAVAVEGIVIVVRQKLRMQNAVRIAHAPAPLRIWAIWINFIGSPMR